MKLGSITQLDAAAQARINEACEFISQKVGQLRFRVTVTALCASIAALALWTFTGLDVQLIIGGALAVTLAVAAHARRELARWYKRTVVRYVVEAIGPELIYTPASSLTKSQFHDMDMFRSRADVWTSEDQVAGRRNAVAFALHEVRAARREKRGKHTHEVVFFKGLIVALEFNKNFHGHTVVVPEHESKWLGGLFGEAETRRRKDIVRLANADFERVFTAYSTDDQEAHYLLTPKLMELVLAARQRLGDLRLAFYTNYLYVAVPSSRDRFELGLFGRVSPESVVSDLADVIALAEQLVDVLDLETRIWTRA